LFAAEDQQLPRELRGISRGFFDLFCVVRLNAAGVRRFAQKLSVSHDRAEDVVKIVRNAARQEGHFLQLLRV
jgi:hypothetical protein